MFHVLNGEVKQEVKGNRFTNQVGTMKRHVLKLNRIRSLKEKFMYSGTVISTKGSVCSCSSKTCMVLFPQSKDMQFMFIGDSKNYLCE